MIKAEELLNQITEDEIIEIMEDLGSPCFARRTNPDGSISLMFQTICHGGHSHKLQWYSNTKRFECWTNCGNMSLFDLVMKIKKCDFTDSFRYVATKLGINLQSSRYGFKDTDAEKRIGQFLTFGDSMLSRQKYFEEIHDYNREITKFYDDTILGAFDNNSFYEGWINEGISISSMRKYKISYYWPEKHIIIPHYNIDGKLVGIRRRSLKPEDSNNKYMPEIIQGTTYAHSLGYNLYGLDKNYKAIQRQKKAIIVEGEKSVLLSDTYYGDSSIAVATCGFSISKWQINTLMSLGVDTVYIGFDKDFDITNTSQYQKDTVKYNDYLHYRKRLDNIISTLNNNFIVKVLFDTHNLLQIKDSPMDRGKETLEKLMDDAKGVLCNNKGLKIV